MTPRSVGSLAAAAGLSLLLLLYGGSLSLAPSVQRPLSLPSSAGRENTSVQGQSRPTAIALFAPHKTGSTFFVSFLHDLSEHLGMCLFTENAAFMYSPRDRTKCSSPSCGYPPGSKQRRYPKGDSGWGECTSFTDERLEEAAVCMDRGACPLSGVAHGVVWGPIRLPPAMQSAARHAYARKWIWHLVLHQRHPLDTLISEFHSFGWTHPPAPEANAQQRQAHNQRQERIRNISADDYVTSRLPGLRERYAPYLTLLHNPPVGVHIIRSRYEDMVLFFPHWLSSFLTQLGDAIPPWTHQTLLADLLRAHSPAFQSDGKHKRGVLPGAHLKELQPRTIVQAYRDHTTWMGELGYT